MANPTWGMLAKSATDNETIEQAIARLILAHETDAESHLGPDESLQSHKAAEIIDHLAGSIIQDKIGNLEVTPDKINRNILYAEYSLESIDGFNKIAEGAGASVALESVGKVATTPGSTNGNRAVMNLDNSSIPAYTEKDPFFQVWVSDSGDEVSDIGVSFGMESPFDTANGGFGIEWIRADNKTYGFYNTYYSAAWHRERVELKTGAPYGEIWRAEWYHTEKVIKFYIGQSLIATVDISAHYLEDDDDFYLAFGAKQQNSYAGSAVFWQFPIWGQKL